MAQLQTRRQRAHPTGARSLATVAPRPKPTAAAALLVATALSLPFGALALFDLLF
ncbi:hypothetical protein KO516_20860 [Citreicella sp. C3M06]|uniref:hypothetical protein n=1 Tax=Roseobacteraceae TaxID=2854170 RepID=UPI001C07F0CA|nr:MULTISPECIES: hypothetical protein [Roseobacteraceae]MBU2963229.1 hypothetical protein [Citreicella sp. C3M06]MDO6585566.1 hypothetical protein [Salipiger sp. 1_MG-2023]